MAMTYCSTRASRKNRGSFFLRCHRLYKIYCTYPKKIFFLTNLTSHPHWTIPFSSYIQFLPINVNATLSATQNGICMVSILFLRVPCHITTNISKMVDDWKWSFLDVSCNWLIDIFALSKSCIINYFIIHISIMLSWKFFCSKFEKLQFSIMGLCIPA